jgi:FlaG/FlaF family flagellin (archaellin)
MHRSWRNRLLVVIATVGLVATGSAAALAGLAPTLVKGGTGDQNSPTADGTTLSVSGTLTGLSASSSW